MPASVEVLYLLSGNYFGTDPRHRPVLIKTTTLRELHVDIQSWDATSVRTSLL